MSQNSKNIYADLAVALPPTEVEYTRLGEAGLKISKIILGTMSYGSKGWAEWVLEEEEALPLLEHAYNVGINTWDTVNLKELTETVTRLTLSRHIFIPTVVRRRSLQKHSKSIRFLGKMS
jgi:hypothetical protein